MYGCAGRASHLLELALEVGEWCMVYVRERCAGEGSDLLQLALKVGQRLR